MKSTLNKPRSTPLAATTEIQAAKNAKQNTIFILIAGVLNYMAAKAYYLYL